MKRFMSPAFFAVVVICFFLPFLSVSCNPGALSDTFGEDSLEGADLPQGEEIEISVTGWQIVANQEPELEGLDDTGQLGGATEGASDADEPFPGRIFAIVALAAAVLGIGLSLMSGRIGPAASLALGIVGVVSLFLLRSSVKSRLGPAALFGVEIGYKPGYWLALAGFIAAGGVGVWRLMDMRPAVPAVPAPPPEAAPGAVPPPPAPPSGTEPPAGASPPAEPPPP